MSEQQIPITAQEARTAMSAFDLARIFGDGPWPLRVAADRAEAAGLPVRTVRHDLEELAVMSGLRTWMERWIPLQIHAAVRAGAGLAEVTAAAGMGESELAACWREWVDGQRHMYQSTGRLGVTESEYDQVRRVVEPLRPVLLVVDEAQELFGGGREYTHPDVATRGVVEGWAEAETDPTRIDWAARQARAAIPFEVVGGRPVNPCEKTPVRFGRNELGHWGEQLCADAVVTASLPRGWRNVLLVERADGHGWALPGGYVEAGEAPAAAAVRELAEETGLHVDVATVDHTTMAARYVPDPRGSDESWMVTVPTRIELGEVGALPVVAGRDDARRAVWVLAPDFNTLVGHLQVVYGGEVFAAHRALLAEILDGSEASGGVR